MNLTEKTAYEAMIIFLEKFYFETNSNDVGGLLSDLQLLPDGDSADPAAWKNWLRSIDKVLKKNDNSRPYSPQK